MTEKKEDESLGSFYMGRMRPPPARDRVLPRGVLTAATVLAFAGIIWYAYPQGKERYTDIDVPVIAADTASYKSKPTDPGGMEVRHQDSTVFDTVEKKSSLEQPEKILPRQEEPLDKKMLGLDTQKPQLNLEPETKLAAQKLDEKPAPVKKEEVKPVVKAASKSEPKVEPKVVPVVSSGTYIQLGAYKDVAGAKEEWTHLQKKYAQLKKLSMRTEKVSLGAKGILYRLQAGSVSEVGAKDICETLKKGNAACIVVNN